MSIDEGAPLETKIRTNQNVIHSKRTRRKFKVRSLRTLIEKEKFFKKKS